MSAETRVTIFLQDWTDYSVVAVILLTVDDSGGNVGYCFGLCHPARTRQTVRK